MFNNIKKSFSKILKNISGKGRITKKNIKNTLREIKKTLLEADVPLYVIKKFLENIKKKKIGKKINYSLTPDQEFIKLIKKELIYIMGNKKNNINFSKKKPSVFLIVGIQGSGKTSSVGKLAKFIKDKYKKRILTTSTDIYRPAAIKQLQIITEKNKIDFFSSNKNQNPIEISKKALQEANLKSYDILIIDTAGRLNNDIKMMNEIKKIKNNIKPTEILFTLDSMMGQDAINTAQKFNEFLDISGIILTKLDSDTRSGSAFSVNYILKKPIKFISKGEKINDFEIFKPNLIVSRILGMENIISIIEEIDKKVKKKEIKKINHSVNKKSKFNLNDFKIQIQQINKISKIKNLISIFNINNTVSKEEKNKNTLKKMNAIIDSMTKKEREYPNIIKGSRKKRIAKGSGTNIQNVNQLLKKFNEFKKIIKKIKNNGIKKLFQNFKQIKKNIF